MKVIISDDNKVKICYIQIKDLVYIANKYNSSYVNTLVKKYRQEGKQDMDFVSISDERLRKVIYYCPYIADFSELVKLDVYYLCRLIINNLNYGSEVDEKKDREFLANDISNLIDFKYGKLSSKVPLLIARRIDIGNNDLTFGESTILGKYLIKSKNDDFDYNSFMDNNYRMLFGLTGLEGECTGYSITKIDNSALVSFNIKKKIIKEIKKKLFK